MLERSPMLPHLEDLEMKNRIFVALLLAGVLALPALAQQTATQANARLTTVEQVVGNIDQYKASTQTEIRFRPGQSVLSKNAKAALDDMATPLKDQRGYIVEVQGFSSGHGQAAIATS